VKMANIKFEKLPVCLRQFDILKIRVRKNKVSCRGRAQMARLLYLVEKNSGESECRGND
jgi:hypothetical protein